MNNVQEEYEDKSDELSFDENNCNDFMELLYEFDRTLGDMDPREIYTFINEHMHDELLFLVDEYQKIKENLSQNDRNIVLKIFIKTGIAADGYININDYIEDDAN